MAIKLPRLPQRPPDAHKGVFGSALLVGGSRGMSGAITLAGLAALRGGSGLVTLALPASIQDAVAGAEPSYMTVALPADSAGRFESAACEVLAESLDRFTAVGCGPGLGQSAGSREIAERLYSDLEAPLVLDADGLNVLANQFDRLSAAGPRILTPHPGEFRRLAGQDFADREEMETAARQWAAKRQVVVVLKGHETLVTDGETSSHNPTGNPGMATGGTGDVLTGLLVALLCQGLGPLQAARLGTYLHGMAGDRAAAQVGQVSLIASDLVKHLPEVLREYVEQSGDSGA